MTTTTTGATTRMMSNIEAKVGTRPTASEVRNAVTEIVTEADRMFIGIDNGMVERMVNRYWEARGIDINDILRMVKESRHREAMVKESRHREAKGMDTSMPEGHRCHAGEFTECMCPREVVLAV